MKFTEAITHWSEQPEARQGLTRLYWHRYLEAEQARDRTAERTYAPLVEKFGGDEYRALVRCEREVRARCELPAGYETASVDAYLYRYEVKDAPPLLVPVPYDPARQEAFDAADLLAKDLAFGRPVPLAVALAAPGAGGVALPPAELAALESRAAADVAAGKYAAALPALDRLTRAVPASVDHAYNLACCLAVAARETDPYAWLVVGAGADAVKELAQRTGADPLWTAALAPQPVAAPVAWNNLAFVALEESVRRGYRDAAHAATDADLAALRPNPAFALLLALMRADLPLRHARVLEVVADSQAAKLGVQAGDVLLSVSQTEADVAALETVAQVSSAIQSAPAGKEYRVALWRGGARVTVTATGGAPLGVRMAQTDTRPESPTRFPGTAGVPPALTVPPEVERARWTALHPLRQSDRNRIPLPVTRDPAGGRPFVALALTLPRGSYLLHVPPGQGLTETRYPFEVARDLDWDERCELVAAEDVPPLPPALDAPDGAIHYWTYIAAAPYRASGDPQAQQSQERDAAILRVAQGRGLPMPAARKPGDLPAEGFYLARFEVASGMYLQYLNDREHHKVADAFARVPRQAVQASDATAYWKARENDMKEGNPEPAVLMRIHEFKVWVLPILAAVPRNMRNTVGRWPQEQVNELQQLVVRARYSPGERAAAGRRLPRARKWRLGGVPIRARGGCHSASAGATPSRQSEMTRHPGTIPHWSGSTPDRACPPKIGAGSPEPVPGVRSRPSPCPMSLHYSRRF